MPLDEHRRMGMGTGACRMQARAKLRWPEVRCHTSIAVASVHRMVGARYQVGRSSLREAQA